MNFIEHVLPFTTQADADNVFQIPLATHGSPMSLLEANVYLSAVAGSPTAVTIDVDLTDGTTTKAPIAASSVGTAAGQTRHVPAEAILNDGDNTATIDTDDNWRAEVDFNFTGGSTPTVTGTIVLRWGV